MVKLLCPKCYSNNVEVNEEIKEEHGTDVFYCNDCGDENHLEFMSYIQERNNSYETF